MKLNEHRKMNPNGTGLGLSICKHIVEKMGGKIKVDSVPNIGTTFRVLISTKVKLSKEPKFLKKKSLRICVKNLLSSKYRSSNSS